VHGRVADVTESEAVFRLVYRVERELGRLERVYNAAAIQPTSPLLDQDVDEIHRVMATNYGGVVNVSKAVMPRLLSRGRGALINFASIAGWVPNMHFGAYAASKFAVVAFTEILCHETRGQGVHVCCVCPGQVDTPLRAQATSRPRIMERGPAPAPPAFVLDAIDRAVARRSFWVFPGATTRAGWWLRRLAPSVLWKIDHDAEGS
jgi:NAD(P)-dependent dehydrogenase (short-subunit alcohol dehydrogenase family)